MRRRSLLLSCAAVGVLAAYEGHAAEIVTDSPAATIASLQQGLVAMVREGSDATIADRYGDLEPLIVATHDLPYIAEFALRRQWASLTEDERQRFSAAFERLSVMTYAARFRNVAPDAFRPIEAAAPDANGRVQVTTAIKREGQPDVSLEYLLQDGARGWRIINVVADGVSDLALKRAEYQRLFASGGIGGLIAELEQQTQRLERD
jgi:phospholipid transport system substrate-binding protein